jgi:hypothetical protein
VLASSPFAAASGSTTFSRESHWGYETLFTLANAGVKHPLFAFKHLQANLRVPAEETPASA